MEVNDAVHEALLSSSSLLLKLPFIGQLVFGLRSIFISVCCHVFILLFGVEAARQS